MDTMKRMRWTLYITGAILIALGLWSLTYPVEALLSLAFALGVGFCLSGVNYLIADFSLRTPLYPKWFVFLLGLLDLAMGIIMIARLGLTAALIPLFVASWLVLVGVLRIVTSFQIRNVQVDGVRVFPKWWLMLLNGLVLLLCAYCMYSSPVVGGLSVVIVLGGSLIAEGVLLIAEGRMVFAK